MWSSDCVVFFAHLAEASGYVVLKVKGVAVVMDPALVTWLAPLPLIFPMGGDFHATGSVATPFSPTASDDGMLTFSDEKSRDVPQGQCHHLPLQQSCCGDFCDRSHTRTSGTVLARYQIKKRQQSSSHHSEFALK